MHFHYEKNVFLQTDLLLATLTYTYQIQGWTST